MKQRLMIVVNVVLLVLIVAGTIACGGEAGVPYAASKAGPTAGTSGSGRTEISPPAGTAGRSIAPKTTGASPDSAARESAMAAGPTTTTGAAMAPEPIAPSTGFSDAPTSGGAGSATTRDGKPAPPASNYQSNLTAGQVDDNARFSDYLNYLRDYQGPAVHPMDVTRRLFVRVLDNAQHPIAGARVQIFDGDRALFDGRTVSDGRVLFFPSTAGAEQTTKLRAVVTKGQQRVESSLKSGEQEQVVSLSGVKDNTGAVGLDLVFLLDATGSMGDEISKIKATVDSIAGRIELLPGSSKPRFGLVAYRDRGDDYVTRSWDFTGSVQQFSSNLANVEAGGGGDVPESVNAGLDEAIHLPGWSDASAGRHLRMIVLVGDAPPHLDYPNDYEYTGLLQQAVANGIKIFPIGASGLDDQGEYIFRQFAEVTQGKFVFLTYANGVSGEPGVATDHHVSDFTVQNLDSLVVGLVADEIANQTGQRDEGTAPKPAPVPAFVDVVMPATPDSDLFLLPLGFLGLNGTSIPLSKSTTFWLAVLFAGTLAAWTFRTPRRARVAPATISQVAQPTPDIVRPDNSPSNATPAPAQGSQAYAVYMDLGALAGETADGHNGHTEPRPGEQLTLPLPALVASVGSEQRRYTR